VAPAPPGALQRRRLAAHAPEALLAVAVASAAWLLTASGSDVAEAVRSAPVVVENLPAGYVVESVAPAEVEVTLSGPRRALFFGDPSPLRAPIDARLVRLGRRTFQIAPGQVEAPPGLEVVAVEPAQVKISVREVEGPPG
jgi:hypothetical protein